MGGRRLGRGGPREYRNRSDEMHPGYCRIAARALKPTVLFSNTDTTRGSRRTAEPVELRRRSTTILGGNPVTAAAQPIQRASSTFIFARLTRPIKRPERCLQTAK